MVDIMIALVPISGKKYPFLLISCARKPYGRNSYQQMIIL